MRSMLIGLFATGIAAGAAQAGVLGQSQEVLSGVFSFHQSRAFFQVFKPSVDGQLDHVDVHLQMLIQGLQYPVHVSILTAENGAPGDTVLAEVTLFEELIHGWNWYSVDLLPYSVFLSSDEEYGIMMSSGIPHTWAHTFGFSGSDDRYTRGDLWVRTAGPDWQEFRGGQADMQFHTYMIQGPVALSLSFDIKPGSCPNPLNRKSRGKLPVALLGTDSFDVSNVDVATLQLGRADGVGAAAVPLQGPRGPRLVIEDVGTPFEGELCDCHDAEGDAIDDLSMKFDTQHVVQELLLNDLLPGDTVELVLTGSLLDGTPFSASDCTTLVGNGP